MLSKTDLWLEGTETPYKPAFTGCPKHHLLPPNRTSLRNYNVMTCTAYSLHMTDTTSEIDNDKMGHTDETNKTEK